MSWIDVLAAGLAGDPRDGCPVEPLVTEAPAETRPRWTRRRPPHGCY
ncbi:MAG: hypothetical protein K2X97_15765 [Mycobacteriaceae bacterium]|nr:hypothetical protein [Mycobacteriaceae bacterium]